MFPFDLPGPQFLVFYAALAAAVIAALYFGRLAYESGPPPQLDTNDPYLLACLRGGPTEAARVATLALIDRDVLGIANGEVRRTGRAPDERRLPRLEQAVLEHFRHADDLVTVTTDLAVLAAAEAEYEERLRELGLIPDARLREMRRQFMLVATAVLIAIGGIKLVVALTAGRHNVFLLIIMMVVALVIVWRSGNPYRSRAGDRYLESFRGMFAGLRRRAGSIRPGGGSREVLWLTSLFGVAALPTAAFPFVRDFRPRADGGSGCGSAGGCGSGGGCGGGGGGCGGCGS